MAKIRSQTISAKADTERQKSSDAVLALVRETFAARIAEALDDRGVSVCEVARQTGLSRSDLSRIRNRRMQRFTLDRLVMMLAELEGDVQVKITFQRSRS